MKTKLFIPFIINDGRGSRERRLKVSIIDDTNKCSISEEFKIKDTWYDSRNGYNIIDFPIEIVPELAEALQRLNKLLILK